jgi:hypothetical protein
MNVMLVSLKLDPSRIEEVDRHLREDVVSWATRQAGFVCGQWLRRVDGQQGLGLVVFDTEEHANAAADGPRSQPSVQGRAWNTESVAVFELVAQA